MPSVSTQPAPASTRSPWVNARTSSRRRAAGARSRNRFEVSLASPTGPSPCLSRAARASFFLECCSCGRLFGLVEEAPAHGIARLRDVTLGEHDLEEMRASPRGAEHLGAAVEIDAPDAPEALVEFLRIERPDLVPVAVEALGPDVERQRVVAAQVLDVDDLQDGILHVVGDDGQARNDAPC